jgi:hypothetical protein
MKSVPTKRGNQDGNGFFGLVFTLYFGP